MPLPWEWLFRAKKFGGDAEEAEALVCKTSLSGFESRRHLQVSAFLAAAHPSSGTTFNCSGLSHAIPANLTLSPSGRLFNGSPNRVTEITYSLAFCTYQTSHNLAYVKRGCSMFATKLPNPTATFFVTLVALMVIVGLLFWAVGAR